MNKYILITEVVTAPMLHPILRVRNDFSIQRAFFVVNTCNIRVAKYCLKLCMVWRNKNKLWINSKLADTTMCKSLKVSVGSEKSRLGIDVSNRIL